MESNNAIDILSALAQETRLDAFRLTVRAGPQGIAAGDLAQALDVRANTLSTHLAQLSRAGLVSAEREGRTIRYAARMETLGNLIGFLADDCCGGHPDLCLPELPVRLARLNANTELVPNTPPTTTLPSTLGEAKR